MKIETIRKGLSRSQKNKLLGLIHDSRKFRLIRFGKSIDYIVSATHHGPEWSKESSTFKPMGYVGCLTRTEAQLFQEENSGPDIYPEEMKAYHADLRKIYDKV